VEGRREELKVERTPELEHLRDCILASENVVVGQPDLVVITPAVPRVQQLGQAGSLRAGDHVTNNAVQAVL
jgi:hypothetical protein